MKFQTILADPPWDYETYSEKSEASAERHYTCMDIHSIRALPVSCVAAKNCVLMMWVTWTHLELALSVIHAWGFTYKSGYPWLKLNKSLLPRIGTGFHSRGCTEPLLIATKGSPRSPEPFERLEGVMFTKQGKHSAKPDEIYERAELYDAPYLEMFARPDGGLFPLKPGWVQIGNEITGRSIECDLLDLAADRPLPILPHLREGVLTTDAAPSAPDAPATPELSLF